jgi:transmembrane sensor
VSSVVVDVERGIVLVRGERVADRVQRLVAGERLDIRADLPPSPSSSASSVGSDQAAGPFPNRPAPRASETTTRDRGSWRDLARKGDYAEAYQSLGADGIASRAQTADLEQLLALADVARFSEHPADAVEPLRRAISEGGRDARAALAAFTLGRVHLDSLNDPRSAARDFDQAVALGLPKALLEDAYLRRIEARAKSGDREGARDAWEAHRKQFPDSTRTAVADRWGLQP